MLPGPHVRLSVNYRNRQFQPMVNFPAINGELSFPDMQEMGNYLPIVITKNDRECRAITSNRHPKGTPALLFPFPECRYFPFSHSPFHLSRHFPASHHFPASCRFPAFHPFSMSFRSVFIFSMLIFIDTIENDYLCKVCNIYQIQ